MIKARPKYPMDFYDNIYIDNIQKAVVICLIISTTFPFGAGSSVTSEKCIVFEDPASKGNDNSFLNIIDVHIIIIQISAIIKFSRKTNTRIYEVRCPPWSMTDFQFKVQRLFKLKKSTYRKKTKHITHPTY